MTVVLQHQFELDRLRDIHRQLQPVRTLEIGCWDGGTLREWMTDGGTVVAVDDVCRFADDWQNWAQAANTTLHLIQANSHAEETIAAVRELGPFDFIFVDADHAYEAVSADFRDYAPMLRPGGAIAFHDIRRSKTRPDLEVWKLWRRLKGAPGAATVEILKMDEDWGGIGVLWASV